MSWWRLSMIQDVQISHYNESIYFQYQVVSFTASQVVQFILGTS